MEETLEEALFHGTVQIVDGRGWVLGLPGFVRSATGAQNVREGELVQSLWSGFGSITRWYLEGCLQTTAILKKVAPPSGNGSPEQLRSHQRKIRSYEVEISFYLRYAMRCDSTCRIPRLLGAVSVEKGSCRAILLEDLDAEGFSSRGLTSKTAVSSCVRWLANFHAVFMHLEPSELWEEGTYWHLDTRPDELASLKHRGGDASLLLSAAVDIDKKLSQAKYRTILHGDAKVDNFCFSVDGKNVAALDWQYVGGGCGMKDLSYFLSSVFDERQLERWTSVYLDEYFECLTERLNGREREDASFCASEIESEWRGLYPFAVADFQRFLLGWSGESHNRCGKHSRQQVLLALDALKEQSITPAVFQEQ